jgi:hypothetical protein
VLQSGDPTVAERIAKKIADQAVKGDVRSAEFLADRSEGKPPQKIQTAPSTDNMDAEEVDRLLKQIYGLELPPVQ